MTSEKIGESRVSFSDAQIRQTLKLCKDTTRDHVLQMITRGFDITVQKLEDMLANVTAEQRAQFQKDIREIRNKEAQVHERYRLNYDVWFDTGTSPLEEAFGSGPISADTLSLMDSEDLEQQIIVERLVAGAAAETQSEFAHLNRRFCFLRDARIKPVDNPIGPTAQGELLIDTLEAVEVSPEVYKLGLQVMEDHFSDALGYLYATLNKKLVAMGVMPDVKHHIWRTADELRGGRGQSRAGLTESQRKVIEDRRRATDVDEIGDLLKKLLGSQEGDSKIADQEGLGKSFLEDNNNLLDTLDALQENSAPGSLLEKLDAKSGETGIAKPAGASREVLALTDKLFAQFQKPFLRNPESRQSILARKVNIPLAKLAIVDPRVLMEPEHPVREVLKQLRSFADILEIKDPLVQTEFYGQFENLVEEFEFIAAKNQNEQKAIAEAITAEIAKIKSIVQQNIGRLHEHYTLFEIYQKRRRALADFLRAQMEGRTLSPGATNFICSGWLDVLQHLAVGQNLDWPDDRLTAPTSDLLEILQGDQSQTDSIVNMLRALGLYGVVQKLKILTERGVETESALQQPTTSACDEVPDLSAQQAAQKAWLGNVIKPGIWLKVLGDKPEARTFCRLYRIYDQGQHCLFVDGLGLKAFELTAVDVQSALSKGRIKLAQ